MLEDSPRAKAWLAQFDLVDSEVARQLLRTLRLISHTEFDRSIQAQVERIRRSVGDENLAVFPVTELIEQPEQPPFSRVAGSSADRVRHMIENLGRVYGAGFLANPTVHSMRSERVRNILFVDDFIGSGRRVTSFWAEEVSKSVKSWASFGWTKLWLTSYAAFTTGVSTVRRRIRSLRPERIVTAIPPWEPGEGLTEPMQMLARKYARFLTRSSIPLGMGSAGANIVFEHGCPNNAPPILWDRGRLPNGKRFKPLFPGRGIPTDLQPIFGAIAPLVNTEVLWSAGQYKLALALLESLGTGKAPIQYWSLITALGIASRSTWDDARIAKTLILPLIEVEKLRKHCYSLHLLDSNTYGLTAFGKDFLERIRQNDSPHERQGYRTARRLTDVYYPDSYQGMAKR